MEASSLVVLQLDPRAAKRQATIEAQEVHP
jgi:hypothetical protein